MFDHIIEEMADAIAKELHIDHNDVLHILHHYWQDKIAHVWQVEDMLETALNTGTPITKEDAVAILKDLFEGHDAELGITWMTLEVALQEYRLDWKSLPEDRYPQVQGVFKVWRKGDPVAHQIGLFPNCVQHNLPQALAIARSLADETPGTPILIGCQPLQSDEVEPWLSVMREEENHLVEEGGEACMP